MAVQCPYCEHSLALQGAKPGKYATTCPKCKRKFALAIPDDPDLPPLVKPLPAERLKNPTAPMADPVRTVAATGAWTTPDRGDAEATADFSGGDPAQGRGTLRVPEETGAASIDAPPTASMVGPALSSMLGGYQILKELGRGGMGAVYLARQLSLNRSVALKVMRPEWARNATFVARFTREAYAAAQLSHHNVVQIYDFGEDKGTSYFSMEFVDGQTLGGLLKQKKRLDPEEAVGYILQAARGLKFAHDQSMIHRDIKPDNLLLNNQGVVKVADLGLVKTPEVAEAEEKLAATLADGGPASTGGVSAADWASAVGSSQITQANVAMGTPAFMAPEQARDASRVDARADIYSLGCTLYDLVTGRPPFEGRTAIEVLSKIQTEPIPPPETIVKRVSPELSSIILTMTAKKPEQRFRDLGEVIKAFEAFLGVSTAGPFSPKEEHANLLEESVRTYNAAPTARIRSWIVPGLLALCGLMAIFALLGRKPVAAGAFLGFGLMTALADFVIGGIRGRSALFDKARGLVVTTPIGDWLIVLVGAVVFLGALVVFKLFWVWLALGIAALVIAVVLNSTLDRKLSAERAEPVDQALGMLRTLRLQGLEEDALRQFVCKYAGNHWEEFYEELFGYEAKLEARERWGRGERGKARPKFAVWRDPVATWIDVKVKARREARERTKIQKIEEAGLVAQGENLMTARRKSKRAAEAMVALAAEIRQSVNRRDLDAIPVNRSISRSIRDAAVKPEKVLIDHPAFVEKKSWDPTAILDLVFGPKPRFLLGLALVAGCLLWMQQNGIFDVEQHAKTIAQVASDAVQKGDLAAAQEAATKAAQAVQKDIKSAAVKVQKDAEPPTVQIVMVPEVLRRLVSSLGAGVAGLLLILSSFFQGWKLTLFALPAAAIPVFFSGMTFLQIGSLSPSLVPSVVGVAVFVLGVLFGRSKRD
jgi:eukaryotic-like serine/threonine-protein kinase